MFSAAQLIHVPDKTSKQMTASIHIDSKLEHADPWRANVLATISTRMFFRLMPICGASGLHALAPRGVA